jgi:hypothetical protein
MHAGVTSLDSFSVATPVVTHASAQHGAGMLALTAGMYKMMGMGGRVNATTTNTTTTSSSTNDSASSSNYGLQCCTATSTASYIASVVRLGKDHAWHAAVKSRIVSRRGVLYENAQAISEWERFLIVATATSKAQGPHAPGAY